MGNIHNPPLTRDNDPERTEESMSVVIKMAEALQAGSNDTEAHFHKDFRWMANTGCYVGCADGEGGLFVTRQFQPFNLNGG
jgi:hypothetical protein